MSSEVAVKTHPVDQSQSAEDEVESSEKPATTVIVNGDHHQAVVLLQGDLSLYPTSKGIHRVTVLPHALTCVPLKVIQKGGDASDKSAVTLRFSETVGCQCMKGRKADDIAVYVTVFAYIRRPGVSYSQKKRQRQTVVFVINKFSNFDDNFVEASKWQLTIEHLVKNWSSFPLSGISDMMVPAAEPCRLLVLINPHSGHGKSVAIFKQRFLPVLSEANIQHKAIVTEYAGHACEMMKSIDLDEWYGIVIVSGDGLMHEVINGLMQRADWEKAIKKPLGVLPGGSGNALCAAILTHAAEPVVESSLVSCAAFVLAKHQVLPMDLVAVDTSKKRLYSFLSVAWGIIADVDIESERYRRLGNARFTVGAVVRIVSLRHYRGRLSFLPVGDYKIPESKKTTFRHSISQIEGLDGSPGNYIPRSVSNLEDCMDNVTPSTRRASTSDVPTDHPMQNGHNIPQLDEVAEESREGNDALAYSTSPTSPTTPTATNSYFLGDLEPVEQPNKTPDVEQNENKIDVSSDSGSTRDVCDSVMADVETPLLTPLHQPVPDNWLSIEDDFVFVVIMYQTHLGTDYMAAPHSKLDDGVMHLAFLRGNPSRKRVFQLMTTMADGTHLRYVNEEFQHVPVHAFRLEPLTNRGTLTVDGELVDYGPIQGQVLPKMSRVMGIISDSTQNGPTTSSGSPHEMS